MSSIQNILDKENEAEKIIAEAENEALEIKQQADKKQESDLANLLESLEKEKLEKLDYQKGQLVQKHKSITEKGKTESEHIQLKSSQNKKKAIDLILEHISK